MMVGMGTICILYAPVLFYLKDIRPMPEEEMQEHTVRKEANQFVYYVFREM
jgi:hypothetical protein